MRLIDATRLVQLTLLERDKIPLSTVERHGFGTKSPNRHGQSMRGGIRKVLRLIEQAPTIDAVPVVHARWNLSAIPMPIKVAYDGWMHCPECHASFRRIVGTQLYKRCPECGAQMDGEDDGE